MQPKDDLPHVAAPGSPLQTAFRAKRFPCRWKGSRQQHRSRRRLRPAVTRLRTTLTTLAAVGALAAAAGCHAQAESASDRAFGARVHAYLLAHPEVLEEAFDRLQARQQSDKDALAKSAIAGRRQALEHDPRDGVVGNPRGPITVVEFSDYRCPFCKAAEPEVEALLAANPDVRLVLKEFPIIDYEDQSHRSRDAARAALGALPQGRYAQVHKALLAEKTRRAPGGGAGV